MLRCQTICLFLCFLGAEIQFTFAHIPTQFAVAPLVLKLCLHIFLPEAKDLFPKPKMQFHLDPMFPVAVPVWNSIGTCTKSEDDLFGKTHYRELTICMRQLHCSGVEQVPQEKSSDAGLIQLCCHGCVLRVTRKVCTADPWNRYTPHSEHYCALHVFQKPGIRKLIRITLPSKWGQTNGPIVRSCSWVAPHTQIGSEVIEVLRKEDNMRSGQNFHTMNGFTPNSSWVCLRKQLAKLDVGNFNFMQIKCLQNANFHIEFRIHV